jgi:hypothetical protein
LNAFLTHGVAPYYTHQNIAEFWNMWTRPADKRGGFGMDCETANSEIAKFNTMMDLAADSAAVYDNWRTLVHDYQVKGVQAHDARLVAAMIVHGISNVLTLNVKDFARYSGIMHAIHPSSVNFDVIASPSS